MKQLVPLLALVLTLFSGCGGDDDGEGGDGGTTEYSATLRPLNNSGVTGEAVFEQQGDEIRLRITAKGLEPGQIIPTYVRGFAGTREARCPRSDGNLSAREARAYGATVFSVEPFPTIKPAEATLRYDLTLTPSKAERHRLEPLARRTLMLEAGKRRTQTLAVACGEISPLEDPER